MTDLPLTPTASPSDSRIVEDCPTCRRVIWAGTRCLHGEVPLTPTGNNADAGVILQPAVEPREPRRGLRGGTGR